MRLPPLLVIPLLFLSFPVVVRAQSHAKPAASKGRAPVVAKTNAGTYVVKQTGTVVPAPADVTLYSYESDRVVFAAYQDGRTTLMGGNPGDPGRVTMDAARFEGGTRTRLGARSIDSSADFDATLVGFNGELGGAWNDDPAALNNLEGGLEGHARIGAEGRIDTKAGLTGGALFGNAQAGGHLGAKATGQISGSPTLCGAKATATATGQLSLGIGGQASGGFRVDWAKKSVKVGGKLAGTYGFGLGAGAQVEVSLEKIFNDPRAAGRCVTDGAKAGIQALSDGYDRIEKAGAQLLADVITGAKYWRTGVPVPTGSNPPGSNVGRFEETRPLGAPRPPATMSGGGVSR